MGCIFCYPQWEGVHENDGDLQLGEMLKGGWATGILHIARFVVDRGEGLNLEAEN
jgi:hypothetical protein